MWILWVHLSISAATFLMCLLSDIEAALEFKARYPELKFSKRTFISTLSTIIRTLFISIIPLFNIAILFRLVFKAEELKETVIEKTRLKLLKRIDSNDGIS